ncbi:hypothetical protein Q73_08260 [Bacillus coahuilensis m2-6]|uniref:YpfB family protein n=1 Tax=Bacillus coahuilensis p1.1.43 TaxID=1150625 RepID=A0A147K8T3_9BACI|nr:DUF5359 family protein [Bacillus coahuilensis]KUP06594.1 hypothetical protein Q75_08730 [Bacillus coahuilensis p1.1.43]KUP07794.1 hypothetical protein Q73_08260 [Bacillus coahuilensis m2-6]
MKNFERMLIKIVIVQFFLLLFVQFFLLQRDELSTLQKITYYEGVFNHNVKEVIEVQGHEYDEGK